MGGAPHPDPPSTRHPKTKRKKRKLIHLRECPLNQAHPESGVQKLIDLRRKLSQGLIDGSARVNYGAKGRDRASHIFALPDIPSKHDTVRTTEHRAMNDLQRGSFRVHFGPPAMSVGAGQFRVTFRKPRVCPCNRF